MLPGMALSSATVVGRIDLPAGKTWEDILSSPREQAEVVLSFQTIAARALGLRSSDVQVRKNVCIRGAGDPGMAHTHWHRDAAKPIGHVLCVVGDSPTEFLLGDYPDERIGPEDYRGIEDGMRRWRPAPGEVVKVDRFTLHRRPLDPGQTRMFLIGSQR